MERGDVVSIVISFLLEFRGPCPPLFSFSLACDILLWAPLSLSQGRHFSLFLPLITGMIRYDDMPLTGMYLYAVYAGE